jgi:hypothetical protein
MSLKFKVVMSAAVLIQHGMICTARMMFWLCHFCPITPQVSESKKLMAISVYFKSDAGSTGKMYINNQNASSIPSTWCSLPFE